MEAVKDATERTAALLNQGLCGHRNKNDANQTCVKLEGHDGRHRYETTEVEAKTVPLVTIHNGVQLDVFTGLIEAIQSAIPERMNVSVASGVDGVVIEWRPGPLNG